MSKVCNRCQVRKSDESFDRRYDKTGGRRGTCRDCRRGNLNAHWRKWYAKNKAHQNEKKRQWALDNPEKVVLHRMRYYLKNRIRKKAYQKKYYWANHEKCLATSRAYQERRRSVSLDIGWDEGRKAFGLEADVITVLFDDAESSVNEIMLELSDSESAWCKLFMYDGVEIPESIMSSIRNKVANVLFD